MIPQQQGSDVFAGRALIATRDSSGRSPSELWSSSAPRRRAAALAGTAVALVALGITLGQPSGADDTSTSTAFSSVGTTPLGCGVHALDLGAGHSATQTDDPLCTQKELASRLCDLELGDNPTVAASGFLQQWNGSVGQAALLTTPDSKAFRCLNVEAREAHNLVFTDSEWSELISPGSMSSAMSRRLAYG